MRAGGEFWLCLSGGNALGAFHAGAFEAIAQAGLEVNAVAGASIGALVAAIIVGNPEEKRVEKLRQFWKQAERQSLLPETRPSRVLNGLQTLLMGQPGLFHPQIWNSWLGHSRGPNLHDSSPTRRRLGELVDFDLLNSGTIRLVVTAVDVETGELACFDNRQQRISEDHLMASMAAPLLFAPVTIDGRTYVDPGIACNLPLEPLFTPLPEQQVTCIALDTARPDGPVPQGLDAAFSRAQDILFSTQSRRALNAVQAALEEGHRKTTGGTSRVLYLPYRDEAGCEASLKMMDFRRDSIEKRWAEGRVSMADLIAREIGVRVTSSPEIRAGGAKA